jgi:hypothetical protein
MVQGTWLVGERSPVPYVRKPSKSKKAKIGAGVYDARFNDKKVTLPKAPWEDDEDGHSDVGFRDVLRQGVQPVEDDD